MCERFTLSKMYLIQERTKKVFLDFLVFWNSLPQYILTANSLKGLKTFIKFLIAARLGNVCSFTSGSGTGLLGFAKQFC